MSTTPAVEGGPGLAIRRRQPLLALFSAQAVSLIGTRMSMIALPWLVLVTSGSATRTGLVSFAEMAPLVLSKILAGPVIDRIGARVMSVVTDAISMVFVL